MKTRTKIAAGLLGLMVGCSDPTSVQTTEVADNLATFAYDKNSNIVVQDNDGIDSVYIVCNTDPKFINILAANGGHQLYTLSVLPYAQNISAQARQNMANGIPVSVECLDEFGNRTSSVLTLK